MTEKIIVETKNINGESNPEEITLRCNRCGKPITADTAVLTPTGYRCKECVREQQKVFDNTKSFDPLIGFVIAALISLGGSWLVPRLGFFTLFIAPGVGTLIYNASRVAVNRRRSKTLNRAVFIGAILGALPLVVMGVIPLLIGSGALLTGGVNLGPIIWRVVYAILVSTTAYSQTKGMRI